ncbi:hypothetical protein [Streptomyces sp. NPDC021212]|uniref:hypothetical protein n=1 Tax=Streptomyces sp. NPDC021212 TaxID=3365118 RepID=UPI00379D1DE0
MSSQRHRMLAGEPYATPAAPRPAAIPGRPAPDHKPLDHKPLGRRALGHKPLDRPAFHDKAPAPRGI